MELLTRPGDTHTTAAVSSNLSNRYTSIDSQPGQVSGGMVKRRLAMEIPEYDLPTSEGVYKQLYAYGNYIDEVVYASCPGATYTMRRYLHDHLYSPAAIVYLTASNCILVERSEYDAYGATHYYNADYTQTFAVSQHGNPFAFTGREIDSFDFASGVPQLTKMHYRHRDYSPFMGRFYQQDPAQYIDGLNLYEYVKGNPNINIDPLGKEKVICDGIVLKRNHIKLFAIIGPKEADGYGHWWTVINDTESYGWWPKGKVDLLGTIFSVEGELNGITSFGGESTIDPHEKTGGQAEELIYPSINIWFCNKLKYGSSKGTSCSCADCDEIKDCMRDFAKSFKGRWAYPLGPNCHTFQVDMMKACCLRK
ncbi:MAG: RHS repeat-associated core domain-containing protein [Anaerohalosphaeraceae bacterium]